MAKRRLSAILFADIVGYTAMMQQDEQAGLAKARRFRQVIEEQVTSHDGEVLQFLGDGSLCIFHSAVQALHAAKAIQIALKEEPQVPLRIGIHLGDIVMQEGNIYGDGVNLASRVESMGIPGSVLVTERIMHDIKSHPEFQMASLGAFHFKNVAEPLKVFALANEGFAVPDPKTVSGKFQVERPGKPSFKPRKTAFLAIGLVFLIAAVGYMTKDQWLAAFGPASQKDKLAVLPFRVLGEDKQTGFSDGLQEDIIHHLSLVENINVTSKTSLPNENLQEKSLAEISERLSLSHVLEGTIRLTDNEIIVVSQLTHTGKNNNIWSTTLKKQRDANLTQIQQALAAKLSDYVKITLDQKDGKLPTRNIEAFHLYLEARNANRRRWLPETNDAALKLAKKALKLDPAFGEVYALIGKAYYNRVSYFGESKTLLDSALLYSKKGVLLNPNSAGNRQDLGLIHYLLGDMQAAKREFLKAISISPAYGRVGISALYLQQHKHDSSYWHNKAYRMYYQGEDQLEDVFADINLGRLFSELHQYDSALIYLERAYLLQPNQLGVKQALIRLNLDRGNYETALSQVDAFFSKNTPVSFYKPFNAIISSEVAMLQGDWQLAYELFPWDNENGQWQYHKLLGAIILQQLGREEAALQIFRDMLPKVQQQYNASEDTPMSIWLIICQVGLKQTGAAHIVLQNLADKGFTDYNNLFLQIARNSIMKDASFDPIFEQIKTNQKEALESIAEMAKKGIR